jgi:hypothetical protein
MIWRIFPESSLNIEGIESCGKNADHEAAFACLRFRDVDELQIALHHHIDLPERLSWRSSVEKM